jgi:hypothetical protein
MSFALLRAAGLAAAAVIALPAGAWAQQPYQSQANGPYTHSVRAEGVPAVYMASEAFAPRVENNLRVVLWSIRDCDRQSFKDSISNLSAFEKQLGDYGESLVASDPQQARVLINDANTVASLINWLLAKSWSHCKPPSKPIPVTQGRPAFYEIHQFGGGTVSGTRLGGQPPEPPPPPPPPPPESPVRPQDQVMMGPGPIFRGAQPFVGVNFSGDFQTTNFTFSDTGFNVNGSGVMGGGFGGVLFPVPNTNTQFGFRFGGEGGNVTGDIRMPAQSPTFNYTVRTEWTAYQEAMVRIPVNVFKIAPNESPLPRDRVYLNYDYFNQLPHVTGSVGIAESGTSVKGTSGMFSVTDNAVRTGITFTVGAEWPVATLANGGVVELFAQYRGTQFVSTVNVPGGVNIGSFTNQVDVGATVHFGEGISWGNVRY